MKDLSGREIIQSTSTNSTENINEVINERVFSNDEKVRLLTGAFFQKFVREYCYSCVDKLPCTSCRQSILKEVKEELEQMIKICDRNDCEWSDTCKYFFGFGTCKPYDEYWKSKGVE
jgi:translation elongation factor EF-G